MCVRCMRARVWKWNCQWLWVYAGDGIITYTQSHRCVKLSGNESKMNWQYIEGQQQRRTCKGLYALCKSGDPKQSRMKRRRRRRNRKREIQSSRKEFKVSVQHQHAIYFINEPLRFFLFLSLSFNDYIKNLTRANDKHKSNEKRWKNPLKFYLHFDVFSFLRIDFVLFGLLIVRKCLNLFSFQAISMLLLRCCVMFENSLATLELHTGIYIFRYSLEWNTRIGKTTETPCIANSLACGLVVKRVLRISSEGTTIYDGNLFYALQKQSAIWISLKNRHSYYSIWEVRVRACHGMLSSNCIIIVYLYLFNWAFPCISTNGFARFRCQLNWVFLFFCMKMSSGKRP